MARVIDQDIPSEYRDLYEEIARPGFEMFPGSGKLYSMRRLPFRLPDRRGIGTFGGSPLQHGIRTTFRRCVDCFNIQPYSGGTTPPNLGPRNRSWWFNQAIGSGLWYYNYFIRQTINSFFGGTSPSWCGALGVGDTSAIEGDPNKRPWYRDYMKSAYTHDYGRTWSFIKGNTLGYKYLNVYCRSRYTNYGLPLDLAVFKVASPWSVTGLCWNNKPAIGSRVIIVPYGSVTVGSYNTFFIGEAPYGVMLRCWGETGWRSVQYWWDTKEYYDVTHRPYWST